MAFHAAMGLPRRFGPVHSRILGKDILTIKQPPQCCPVARHLTTSTPSSSLPPRLLERRPYLRPLQYAPRQLTWGLRGYQHMADRQAEDQQQQQKLEAQAKRTVVDGRPTEAMAGPPTSPAVTASRAQEADARQKSQESGDDPLKLSASGNKTAKEQRDTDWSIVRRLIGHIWPKGETGAKVRVVLALALLIGGKVSC